MSHGCVAYRCRSSGIAARQAFETVFRAMVSVLERSLRDKKRPGRKTAQAIAALSIGGMVVARTLVDRYHADDLRASCIAAALQLGGWENRNNSKETNKKVRRQDRTSISDKTKPPAYAVDIVSH